MTAPLVILAAGGTGGHVFPAQALAEELMRRGCRLALVTDRRGGAWGDDTGKIEIHRIWAGGVAGKSMVGLLKSIPELLIGTFQARSLLGRLCPAVVVGFGGYASVPTMAAASMGGIKTVIHEQNAVLGRANRLLASGASRIATSFERVEGLAPETASRVIHTGMPVRPAVAAVRDRGYPTLSAEGPVNLLVLGGSQGARVLGEVLPAAIGLLPEAIRSRVRIAQQCRPEDLEKVRVDFAAAGIKAELATFFDDVPERLAAAHLVVARAGASTVAELTAVGRPSILVPYPYATDDHQTANAHALDEAGGGWLMPQEAFTPENLAGRLRSLIETQRLLEKAAAAARCVGRPDAAQRLADAVTTLIDMKREDQ